MVTWEQKLQAWGYPRYRELARVLRKLDIEPEEVQTPMELAKKLSEIARTYGLAEDISNAIRGFIDWVAGIIKPYVGDFFLIIAGSLISSIGKGWIKVVGVVPVALGIYDMAKRLGVV